MKLWRAVRAAWFWAKSLSAEKDNRFPEALEWVRKSEELVPLKPWHRAFEAMLLVRTEDAKRAHDLLAELRQSLKSNDDPDSRYTRRYVQYWLAILNVNPDQAPYERRQAAEVNCRPALKRWLWLPEDEPRDPLDVEFDKWMRANQPKERF